MCYPFIYCTKDRQRLIECVVSQLHDHWYDPALHLIEITIGPHWDSHHITYMTEQQIQDEIAEEQKQAEQHLQNIKDNTSY